jgi:spoIIIJ-associated protein
MQSIETEAKTVEEAISKACENLETTKDKLKVEILKSSGGGLFSFFSSKKVKIRATISKPAESTKTANDAVNSLSEILETIVKKIHPEARVEISSDQGETVLNIIGDGSGIFIGKNGQTLQAFQFIINKIKMNKFRNASHVIVDSESYRVRHISSLTSLAKRLSSKAKKKGGPVATEPLRANDRKIIHMALKQDRELTTWSKGQGNLKKVIIAPKNS